jgi:porin
MNQKISKPLVRLPAKRWVSLSRPSLCGARAFASSLFAASLSLGAGSAAALGPVAVPGTWGGSLLVRERLTGDWGGARDRLGKQGVVLNVDAVLTPQTVMAGGRDTGTVGWGNTLYTLNIDTGKAGWWPGGYINVKGNSGFGNPGISEIGSIVPANAATLFPNELKEGSGLEAATFTQFLSHKLAVMFGKFSMFDLAHGEFHGDIQTQFMNASLAVPMAGALVPLSAFGGGVVLLPMENVSVMGLALDPSGKVANNDIGDAFDDGVMFFGAISMKVTPFGLVGHQSVSGMWSDKTRIALDQDPTNLAQLLLEERFPQLANPGPVLSHILTSQFPALATPSQPLNHEDSTWLISYGLDQYLWQPAGDTKHGIGVFFNFGATDGDPNPIEYSYLAGIGGKGVVPGRSRDSFGIAWSRTQFSNSFVPFLRARLDLGLDHEDTVEMYYNVAITPWLNVSPSMQIIDQGLKQSLGANNRLEAVDTAVVFFLRTAVRF